MALVIAAILVVCLFACAKTPVEQPTVEEPVLTLDTMPVEAEQSTAGYSAAQEEPKIETAAVAEDIWYNSYTLNLEVDPQTRTVTGLEQIAYKNKLTLSIDTLYLNVPLNAFSKESSYNPYLQEHEKKIYQYGMDYAEFTVDKIFINSKEVAFTLKDTVLAIHLSEPFEADQIVDIALSFTSKIPKISHRTGANDKAMWFGGFIPTLAVRNDQEVRTDPYYGAGDPFYTAIANYTVTVTTPKGYTVVGTGASSVEEQDGKQVTLMSAQMVRDFAFSVSDQYRLTQIDTSDGKVISFYHYSELENMAALMLTAKKSVEFYSQNIGEYPYKELNIVECELFFSCGMEFSKLIMMDSTYLQQPEAVASLAHEVGHQWFFNAVGSDQIRSAWMDEGLVMCIQQEILYSPQEVEANMLQDYNRLRTRVDNGFDSRLNQDLSAYENWQSYYRSAYTRGKLMIYSLKKKIGDENFAAFIKEYYTKYAFKIALESDFIALAEKYVAEETEDFFRGWIEDFELPAPVEPGE